MPSRCKPETRSWRQGSDIKTSSKIFLLTAHNSRYGSGHFQRSFALQKALPQIQLILYRSRSARFRSFRSFWAIKTFLVEEGAQMLILDKRSNPIGFVRFLNRRGIRTLALDTSGPERPWLDYVVETLPALDDPRKKNITSLNPALTPSSKTSERHAKPAWKLSQRPYRCLVYLGSIRNRFFVKKLTRALFRLQSQVSRNLDVIVIRRADSIKQARRLQRLFEKMNASVLIRFMFLKPTPSFPARLYKTDLFLCYYGLSAFESLFRGVPFALLSPTRIHSRLASKHLKPFVYRAKTFDVESLPMALKEARTRLQARAPELVLRTFGDLLALIKRFQSTPPRPVLAACPLCLSKQVRIVHRNPWRNLVRCQHCSVIYLRRFGLKPLFGLRDPKYQKDYFESEYQKTYGKTYKEDKPHLSFLAKRRLQTITRLYARFKLRADAVRSANRFVSSKLHLLEIGPAYGYFLDEAKQAGFVTEGIELSAYAAEEAGKKHTVHRGDFMATKTLRKKYDVIALWYVLEHVEEVVAAAKRISLLQRPGQLLCLSTPNASGLSGRFLRRSFLESSPPDHAFIFNKRSLKKFMSCFGYRLVRVEYTGVHADRFLRAFPILGRLVPRAFYERFLGKFLGLGDTFNAYFIKRRRRRR